MAEPESAHHDPAHEQDHDGKFLPVNETFADESGRAYRDDELSIERIEKVYKYVFYHPIMGLPSSPPVRDTYMDCRKIDRRIIPGKHALMLTYKYVIYFGAPLTRK
jgi:hypothetical protein